MQISKNKLQSCLFFDYDTELKVFLKKIGNSFRLLFI